MGASAGDHVTPGVEVSINDGLEAGSGIQVSKNRAVAVLSGMVVEESGKISIQSSAPPQNTPEIGDVVIGEVNRLNEKTAEIRILHIESKELGHRDIPALKLFADIYVSELVDRFIPSAGDALRKRDVVRARIINVEPMLKASTKGNPELGVLHASCPPCGESLSPSREEPDFNVECPRCDYRGFRALSNGFGHGFSIPEESNLYELNRSGQRWTSEAESMLGHDGARPYLSPVADHRRGWSHEVPESARRNRSSRNHGGRPQREMFEATCTLCSNPAKVPFKPTPGKPLRCRPCMEKVESGKANKEELSRERETLKKAKANSEKELGVKLFVGGISYEATESEIKALFSTHGAIKEAHLAIDSESGRSKGFAFITFENKKDALAAIKALNKSELKGRRISVEESKSSGGKRRSRRR